MVSERMRARNRSASASTVTTGITAMMSEACDAEVSLMPRDSKKK